MSFHKIRYPQKRMTMDKKIQKKEGKQTLKGIPFEVCFPRYENTINRRYAKENKCFIYNFPFRY